jgi:hypothetical protein
MVFIVQIHSSLKPRLLVTNGECYRLTREHQKATRGADMCCYEYNDKLHILHRKSQPGDGGADALCFTFYDCFKSPPQEVATSDAIHEAQFNDGVLDLDLWEAPHTDPSMRRPCCQLRVAVEKISEGMPGSVIS